jgi:DNA polymerase-3 subunit epsilon
MIYEFTAIDFETATGYRTSICQVGAVRYKNGLIVEELNLLVQPPENYYWEKFIDIHGITPEQTESAANFGAIWYQLEPFIQNQNLVAHNGFGFDFQCLAKTLEYYSLAQPKYTGHCAYKIFGDNLASLSKRHKINLNHHDALSDAKACGELFLIHLNSK